MLRESRLSGKIGKSHYAVYYHIARIILTELKVKLPHPEYEGSSNESIGELLALVVAAYGTIEPYVNEENVRDGIINESEISMLPKLLYDRLVEADNCYKHGFYTVSCVLCGTVLEKIILEKIDEKDRQKGAEESCISSLKILVLSMMTNYLAR